MEIHYPPTFITTLKGKHILLDTNVFRDALAKPTVFNDFFNSLKEADITLSTIAPVKYELLKGSADVMKYESREKLIDGIIDVTIPITPKTFDLVYDLIKEYKIDGASLHITDLLLGATLMQYRKSIYLLTRDTTDFMQNIFDLPFIINASHTKGIFAYGVYQYTK